jgi:small subunit ribosomal protein S1
MSWTRRIVHPADILNLNDEIEVVVLDVNKDRQEISLGIKQLETNPWTIAAQKYPPGTIVTTKVTTLTNYGAFVEIEPGIDGLVHISDLSWTRKYNHPSDALERGQELKCVVLEVDEGKHRVSLGVKQMTEDPWIRAIPEKYIPGQVVKGKATKLTNFGVFVELEPDLEGLLHISELADHKVENPKEVVETGQEIEIKILRVDPDSRKIGLSLRRVRWAAQERQQAEAADTDTAKKEKSKRRGGLDGPLIPGQAVVPRPGEAEQASEPQQGESPVKEEEQKVAELKAEAKEPEDQKQEEPQQQPSDEAKAKEQKTETQPEQPEQEPEPVKEQQQEGPEDKDQQKPRAQEEQTPAQEKEVAEQPEQEQLAEEKPQDEQPQEQEESKE